MLSLTGLLESCGCPSSQGCELFVVLSLHPRRDSKGTCRLCDTHLCSFALPSRWMQSLERMVSTKPLYRLLVFVLTHPHSLAWTHAPCHAWSCILSIPRKIESLNIKCVEHRSPAHRFCPRRSEQQRAEALVSTSVVSVGRS